MSQHTATRRQRYLTIGAPAALLGSLSSIFALAPATAASAPAGAALPAAVSSATGASAALRTVPATTAPPTYTVQPGDTVSAIAHRFGLRTGDVLTANGLTWRSVIQPGQTLRLDVTATPQAPTVSAAPSASHIVASGDTVIGIARKYGTTVDAVLAANGLTRASVIYPGQTLILAATTPAAAAEPAPTLAAAPAPVAAAGQQLHTVVAGDTLFAIAKKYGTTTANLYALNGFSPSSIIYPGQSISVSGTPAAPAPAPMPASVPATPAQQSASLDAEQQSNAARIVAIGSELGVSDRGIAIALAAAMVESGLRNLDWGDRDSLGLFQQRPSHGWGTHEQILDADRSIRVFFGGTQDPNGQTTRGLLDVSGWQNLAFTDAAQAVQISAYPDRYGQWEAQANRWLTQFR